MPGPSRLLILSSRMTHRRIAHAAALGAIGLACLLVGIVFGPGMTLAFCGVLAVLAWLGWG